MQKRSRAKNSAYNRRKRYNRKTLLWLILFFPVGVTRMLSSACSWKKGVKYAVSGLYLALFAAVLIFPSPYKPVEGSIELIGEDPEVEVYGPEAPETIVGSYTAPVIHSVVLPAKDEFADDGITYVYAAPEQENYHLGTCKFAYASGQELTLYEAHYLGFTPGKCCDAPAYTGP